MHKNYDSIIKIKPEEKDAGKRLDVFLTGILKDYTRSYIKKIIDLNNVLKDGIPVKANYKIKPDEIITVKIPMAEKLNAKPQNIPVDIMFEDEHIVVVNKKRGMVVHPSCGHYSDTLVNTLLYHLKGKLSDINGVLRPGIVHRIDKDTSGVLVVAKTNEAHIKLARLFKTHDIKREYHLLAGGIFKEKAGIIDAPVGRHPANRLKMAVNLKNGKQAVTNFKVIEQFENAAYLSCTLQTGRTHQIRVHLQYIGHPLLGDALYGGRYKGLDINGQALHAKILGFVHPATGIYREFESPLPEDFKMLLNFFK